MIPPSEAAYYAAAEREVRKRDEGLLPPRPKFTEEQLAHARMLTQQAREVVRDAAGLLAHLEGNARQRSPALGSPTVGEAMTYRAGYEDALADIRDIAEWEVPDG